MPQLANGAPELEILHITCRMLRIELNGKISLEKSLLFESLLVYSSSHYFQLVYSKLESYHFEGPVPIYLSRYRFGQNNIIVHRESVPFIVPIIPSLPGLVTWLRRDG